MRRFRMRKTLMDYMVIAITPALIMLLVGSLVFFLLTVFYDGLYDSRLRFIFSCFVFAIVLIARISIEEGNERAVLFAVPLAVVMLVAVMRFSDLNLLFSISLIGLIWWSTDRLTWDSTVIDDQVDSSGEGLLQTLGLDTSDSKSTEGQTTPEPFATTSPEDPPQQTGWFTQRRRQQSGHAPGRWVIYFSLAALPLFGFGQAMIPNATPARLHASFNQMVVYVAAGIGLLMTTSFLGLRRYLRQRQMEMPVNVSGVWLGVGSAMIVGILVLCTALPRPVGGLSVARPFAVDSEDRTPNHWGPFDDGPEDEESGSKTVVDDQKTGRGGPKAGNKGAGNQGSTKGSGSRAKSDRGAKGKGTKSQSGKGKQQSGQGKSQESGGKGEKSGGKGTGDRKSAKGESKGSNKNQSDPSGSQKSSPGEKQSASGNKQNKQQQASPQQGQKNPSEESRGSQQKEKQGQQPDSSDQAEGAEQSSRAEPDQLTSMKDNRSSSRSSSAGSRRRSRQSGTRRRSPQTAGKNNALAPPNLLSSSLSGLGLLAKLVFWLVLIALAIWWIWKNWAQVVVAWQKFLADLIGFWNRLFGQTSKAEPSSQDVVESASPVRPFSAFRNPFSSGLATRTPIHELVRYSFEAVEAWSRERGWPREESQTPLEFVRHIARVDPSVRAAVVKLGDLYSCAAYADGTLASSNLDYLQDLWKQLETAPPHVPHPT